MERRVREDERGGWQFMRTRGGKFQVVTMQMKCISGTPKKTKAQWNNTIVSKTKPNHVYRSPLPLLIMPRLPPQHPLTMSAPPSPPPNLNRPIAQPIPPMTRHEHTAQHIHDLNHEQEKTIPRLDNVEQDRLNVVFHKNARDHVLGDLAALLGDGVLVRKEGARAHLVRVADAVGGGDDGEEVLELVEVRGRQVDGLVERVDEGREEGAEGELRDDVREVEGWVGG